MHFTAHFPKVITLFLALMILFGALLRFFSFQKNSYLHGDVVLHCAVVESLANKKGFFVSYAFSDLLPLNKPESLGYPVNQHPPLWPLLGAALVPFTGSAFTALKTVGLLSGTALIFFSFLFARRFFGKKVALLTTFAVTFSALLIDYSSNGSLYIFQALLYLLFVLCAQKLQRTVCWSGLGSIAGSGWLLNYQNVVLVFAIPVLYVFVFRSTCLYRKNLVKLLGAIGTLFIVVLPWLVRNYLVFGQPFHNINMYYFWGKMGVAASAPLSDPLLIKKIVTWVPWWTTHNIYYVFRELFLLAPVVFAFALWGLPTGIAHLCKRKHTGEIACALIMVLYCGICCIWPVVKFRYFVPLVPFVFAFGFYVLCSLRQRIIRRIGVVISLCTILLFSALTFLSIPSRTFYYGGALTKDIFGKRGEAEFAQEANALLEVALFLKRQPPRPICGEPALHFYTGLPVVLDKNLLRGIKYYSVRPAAPTAKDTTRETVIFKNNRFQVSICHEL